MVYLKHILYVSFKSDSLFPFGRPITHKTHESLSLTLGKK